MSLTGKERELVARLLSAFKNQNPNFSFSGNKLSSVSANKKTVNFGNKQQIVVSEDKSI